MAFFHCQFIFKQRPGLEPTQVRKVVPERRPDVGPRPEQRLRRAEERPLLRISAEVGSRQRRAQTRPALSRIPGLSWRRGPSPSTRSSSANAVVRDGQAGPEQDGLDPTKLERRSIFVRLRSARSTKLGSQGNQFFIFFSLFATFPIQALNSWALLLSWWRS